jgi:hypothetical protein
VPGDDCSYDAHWFAYDQTELAAPGRLNRLVEGIRLCQPGVELQCGGRDRTGAYCGGVYDTGLPWPNLREFVCALPDADGHRAQILSSLSMSHSGPRPFVERRPRGSDRTRHIGCLRLGYPKEQLLIP